MSWISKWFVKDTRTALIELVVKIALNFMGQFGIKVWAKVKEEVALAEATNLSGPEKFKLVYTNMKVWLKDLQIGENLIRFLIEVSVLIKNYNSF